jgi:cbb3-type cytochrome oxidase subunit 3
MTYEGIPHALRSIGTLPVVLIFSALAFSQLIERFGGKEEIMKKFIQIFVICALIFAGVFNTVKYHVYWAQNKKTAESFEITNKEITEYINNLPANREVFAVLNNMQRVPIKLFAWNRGNFRDLHPVEIGSISPKDKNNFTVIFQDFEKDNIIKGLQKRFPDLKFEKHRDSFGFVFYTLSN